MTYKDLFSYRDGESKYTDIFGLCALHQPMANDVALWHTPPKAYRGGAVSGIRGYVTSINIVTDSDPNKVRLLDKELTLMAGVKREFKMKMGLPSLSSLSIDQWRLLMEEALDEFIIEHVSGS